MKTELLLQLADYLDAGQFLHKEFNYKYVDDGPITENGCGTAGCALGELPGCFPDLWEYREIYGRISPVLIGFEALRKKSSTHGTGIISAASIFFDIPEDFTRHLFTPEYQRPVKYGSSLLYEDATPSQVAQHIRDSVHGREELSFGINNLTFSPYQPIQE